MEEHVWAYDSVHLRLHHGTGVRLLTVMDGYTKECLAVRVARHIRSDKGSEFTAGPVREWLGKVGGRTLNIKPGSPWENGYIESLSGKLRDVLLDREVCYTLVEVRGSDGAAVQADLQPRQAP